MRKCITHLAADASLELDEKTKMMKRNRSQLQQGRRTRHYSALAMLLVFALGGCRPNDEAGKFGASKPAVRNADPSGTGRPLGPRGTESAGPPLRVWVVDDDALSKVIQREWLAHSKREIDLRNVTAEEIAKPADADVLIFPSPLLGQFVVERQILPWPEHMGPSHQTSNADNALVDQEASAAAATAYDWTDVFATLRLHELRWGDDLYGVSFGSPELLLMYRQDLFDAWRLSPPTTWTEYQSLVKTIAQKTATGDDSKIQFATLEPNGAGWAARLLLARAAAYARHPNQYSTLFSIATMEPLIDRPPFARALREQAQSFAGQSPEAMELGPNETAARFLAGESAMAIGWPSAASEHPADTIRTSNEEARFALAALPGSLDVYQMSSGDWQQRADVQTVPLLGTSGRIGAIARRSRSVDRATSFLMWLTSREQASRISTRSTATTIFRRSLVSQGTAWVNPELAGAGNQFTQLIAADQSRTSGWLMLRLPRQDRYVQTLDEAVREAMRGEKSVEQALAEAAEWWTKLNQSLGADRAKQAYLQSLGL